MRKPKRLLRSKRTPKPQLNLWGDPIEEKPSTELVSLNLSFEGHRVRMIVIKGEPWWVLADVARVLDYRDAEKAKRLLRARHWDTLLKGTHEIQAGMLIISEAGLYRLMLRSDKPEAERFQDWITDEVLPAIRKTGTYSINVDLRITKTAKRLKCDQGTAERRVHQVDINKDSRTRLLSQGASVRDLIAWHNGGYVGQFGAEAQALREQLGLNGRQTPLDQMSEVVLSQNYHAKAISKRVAEAATVPIPPSAQAEMLRVTAQEIALADLQRLGPNHAYGIVEDAARGKVLDIVHVQISPPAE